MFTSYNYTLFTPYSCLLPRTNTNKKPRSCFRDSISELFRCNCKILGNSCITDSSYDFCFTGILYNKDLIVIETMLMTYVVLYVTHFLIGLCEIFAVISYTIDAVKQFIRLIRNEVFVYFYKMH